MAAKKKNSLVENINRRKKAGVSRSKKDSTVSPEAYQKMEEGWGKRPAAKRKRTATKRTATKRTATKKAASSAKPAAAKAKKKSSAKKNKDPEGGLTAAGRAWFAEKEGAHLRPGVRGPEDTPEKMRRKGSFLRRHYAHPRGPVKDENGNPTRLALAAHAWGEPVPKNMADVRKLARKGSELLEKYKAEKEKQK